MRDSNGQFLKGHSGNPNGRPKGAKNKTPRDIKKLLIEFVSGKIDNIEAYWDAMPEEKKIIELAKYLKFVVPAKIENENKNSGEVSVKIKYIKKDNSSENVED
ncbi:MAG: hypothetical protein J0I41_23550 [Filimonas sp.]|nr:hypothetical protein [Filimonas sp.]